MGSGLILLVIVGAWLAVLVPMALRSHDSATSLRSTDRFGNAMRVLARKGTGRDVLMPRRGSAGVVLSGSRAAEARPPTEPGRTPAQRRQLTLLVLLTAALASLVAGLVGPVTLLAAHAGCDLLLVGFVVHLRRQAVQRAQRRRAEGRRTGAVATARSEGRRTGAAAAARPAVRTAPRVRIAGVPDRMPQRPAPLVSPLPAPAKRYDEPVPAAAATGTDGSWSSTSWSPVPVPPPTYVGKPRAPARRTRVLDLTRPGQWTAAMEGDEVGMAILDDASELDEILDRRRAVNDW